MRSNKDSVSVTPQSSTRLLQFDGLRGLAIIIVVLSHCNILNQGGVANAIFFALAGFLLINPFKDAYEQRFLSIWNILKFYKSRAIRILPAYYLILFFIFFQTGFNVIEKDVFIKLLYFGDIHGHLWYIYSYFWLMYIIFLLFHRIK
jgi:peptidoglycan/LPS O-acetylase OafA/YrhL